MADDTAASGTELPEAVTEMLRAPFDRVLSEPTRLRILAALVGLNGSMTFTALARTIDLSDGRLGTHLGVLTEVGYVDTDVKVRGKRRTTWYAATVAGRAALDRHVEALRSVIEAADFAADQAGTTPRHW